jgi:hypothetical protein
VLARAWGAGIEGEGELAALGVGLLLSHIESKRAHVRRDRDV